MVQHADALVFSTDPGSAGSIAATVAACGLVARSAVSEREAQRMLRGRSPTLAVVDWNPGGDAERVLRLLAREHAERRAVVRACGRCDGAGCVERVELSHPRAAVFGSIGLDGFTRELKRLLRRRVGDLRLEGGSVRHLPSGRRFRHEMGVRLLLAHPESVRIVRNTREYCAMYRFRRWLVEAGSSLAVAPDGGYCSFFHLGVPRPAPVRRAAG